MENDELLCVIIESDLPRTCNIIADDVVNGNVKGENLPLVCLESIFFVYQNYPEQINSLSHEQRRTLTLQLMTLVKTGVLDLLKEKLSEDEFSNLTIELYNLFRGEEPVEEVAE